MCYNKFCDSVTVSAILLVVLESTKLYILKDPITPPDTTLKQESTNSLKVYKSLKTTKYFMKIKQNSSMKNWIQHH